MKKVIESKSVESFQKWQLPNVDNTRVGNDTNDKNKLTIDKNHNNPQELVDNAYKEGYQHGANETEEKLRNQIEDELQTSWVEKNNQIEKLITSLNQSMLAFDKNIEGLLMSIVIKISKQLVKNELQIAPEKVSGIIQEVLSLLPSCINNIQLYLNADDMPNIQAMIDRNDIRKPLQLVCDENLQVGECRVKSDEATVDGTFDTRIKTIMEQVIHNES